jgi:hypothetical protein
VPGTMMNQRSERVDPNLKKVDDKIYQDKEKEKE